MKIFISAGDASGDMHASDLVREIRKNSRGCTVTALGGRQLETAADEFLANMVSLSAFGFWEPVRQYLRLRKIFNHQLKTDWLRRKPDKVILVDYYGFNIHVAEEARRQGIPVYYYISPQVWASRPGRIKRLARNVTKMLVILPFEEKIYRQAGVDAVFVGHPLIDRVPEPAPGAMTAAMPVIGLFPGSRPSVFDKHLPILIEAAAQIAKELPVQFKIVCLQALRERCAGIPYEVVAENDFAARSGFRLAITTSGTVSLENALLGIPMVVFYKLSRFNYWLARRLVRIPYITMVNILLNEPLVPELIQDRATPSCIANEAMRMLNDAEGMAQVRSKMAGVRPLLGEPGASRRAAAIIMAA